MATKNKRYTVYRHGRPAYQTKRQDTENAIELALCVSLGVLVIILLLFI